MSSDNQYQVSTRTFLQQSCFITLFFSLCFRTNTYLYRTDLISSSFWNIGANTLILAKEVNSISIASFHLNQSYLNLHSSMDCGSLSFIISIATVNINTSSMNFITLQFYTFVVCVKFINFLFF